MRQFCTDHAIASGEPLAGTAALARRHLFLRWPKAHWRRPRFDSVGLSGPLRAAMKAASGDGRYVGMVDGPDLQLLCFPESVTVALRDHQHAADLIGRWHGGAVLTGTPLPRTILCCTDGKRDPCCARFGFPVFKALAATAPHYGIDVLQCTHIGGCHFAPSVIVMPDRQRYGRLTPARVPEFLEAIAGRRVYLPGYRGNPALDEIGQTAEAAARAWTQARGDDHAPSVGPVTMLSPDEATAVVESRSATLTVHLQRAQFSVYGNCSDMDGPPEDRPRWIATRVHVPAPPGKLGSPSLTARPTAGTAQTAAQGRSAPDPV